MIKKNYFGFFAFMLITNLAHASWFDGKIPMRACTNGNSIDALSCNKKCVKTGIDFEFQINVSSNLVLKKEFVKDMLINSQNLENCKVISKKNWICETDQVWSYDSKRYIDKHVMNDGVYANIDSVNNVEGKNPICAK